MGFDSRDFTPELVRKITLAGVKDRSQLEASRTLKDIGGVDVSPKAVNRVLHDVGEEVTHLRDEAPSRLSRTLVPPPPADAPQAVAVYCDGGRMMTRQPGRGTGVHGQAWRETKNANFERLVPKTFETDPHPALPSCFCDSKHVADIADSAELNVTSEQLDDLEQQQAEWSADETSIEPVAVDQSAEGEAPATEEAVATETVDPSVDRPAHHESASSTNKSDAESPASEPVTTGSPSPRTSEGARPGLDENRLLKDPLAPVPDEAEAKWQPERLYRTCLSSLVPAAAFGLAMAREALRRRFPEATKKAFVADGLGWNWTIWQKHFPDFVPILDFVHVVEYLYKAAKECCHDEASGWQTYLRWAEQCWQSRVTSVIAEMGEQLKSAGIAPQSKVAAGPSEQLHTAYRYLSHNTSRMDYSAYRREGLPVTSATMESLVKQIHQRVKGTDIFWNASQRGGEGILQLRSSYLCDDDRLRHYLSHRPGHPYVRRTSRKTTPSTPKS